MKIRALIHRLYRKFTNRWSSLPRPLRVLLLLTGIALTCFFIYIFLDSPTFTDEQRYRRAEKANLVGPAKILDIQELPELKRNDYDRIVIADDGDGIIMYLWNTEHDYYEKLVYRKKIGDVTIYAAPIVNVFYDWHDFEEIIVPIYAFDNFPNAVRAELDLTLEIFEVGEPHIYHYSLESVREKSGFFCFFIYANTTPRPSGSGSEENSALYSFTALTDQCTSHALHPQRGALATIRLYDKDNLLVHEEMLSIYTIPIEKLIERGELR